MKIVRIPLQPNSRFHFGEFKFDVNLGLSTTSSFAHSDTLFSALVNSYANIDDAGIFVSAFNDGLINVSSLFYYLKNGDKFICFLPKPVFLEMDSKSDGNHKLRNKIKFVSLAVWQNGFNQEKWADRSEFMIIQNEFVLTKAEFDVFIGGTGLTEINIYKTIQSPKSPIRKNSTNDSIYYQTDIEISSNDKTDIEIGFYFFYVAEDDYELMLKDATNILSKSGIGGEKNNMSRMMGDPQFEELDLGIDSEKRTNISLVSPKDLNDFQKVTRYKTFIRGGRALNHGGKYKTIRLITEGALVNGDLEGQLVEIGTDDSNNRAFRNGKAFLIPVL